MKKSKTFSESIRDWLKSASLFQKEGAEHLKIPERTLRRWLAGKCPHKDRRLIIEERMKTPIFK
jgi:predicted XRE-type DNA-binding protein